MVEVLEHADATFAIGAVAHALQMASLPTIFNQYLPVDLHPASSRMSVQGLVILEGPMMGAKLTHLLLLCSPTRRWFRSSSKVQIFYNSSVRIIAEIF